MTREIVEFFQAVNKDCPDNIVHIYFSEKRGNKYRTFNPQMSNELQKKILELLLPPLLELLQLPIVHYNPVGVLDEENELIISTQVDSVETFKNSLKSDTCYTDMSLIKMSNISFYCVEISYNNKSAYLFRQFAKMSRLRKGILGQLVNNTLAELDNNFLGIDDRTDMVLMDDTLIIINHISLERVFNYRDKFQEMTNLAIGRIVVEGKMTNVEQFSEDCLKDVRIMKRFTELMSKDSLPLFFDNYDRVPQIVDALNLNIKFDKEGRMVYEDKSQLYHIVHLFSDSYFKSLIAERVGVIELEGKINAD
ncbi:DUF4868 domain-containing protein [bacterium]|nr:DUF4868 domain-containing protein [bacterium]